MVAPSQLDQEAHITLVKAQAQWRSTFEGSAPSAPKLYGKCIPYTDDHQGTNGICLSFFNGQFYEIVIHLASWGIYICPLFSQAETKT